MNSVKKSSAKFWSFENCERMEKEYTNEIIGKDYVLKKGVLKSLRIVKSLYDFLYEWMKFFSR